MSESIEVFVLHGNFTDSASQVLGVYESWEEAVRAAPFGFWKDDSESVWLRNGSSDKGLMEMFTYVISKCQVGLPAIKQPGLDP